MLPSKVNRDSKPSSTWRPEPRRVLTDALHRRIRAVKDDSDSGSPNDPGGDFFGARPFSLARQSEESSHDDGDDEKLQEEEAESDTLSGAPENEAASISFGALVKAQASLGKRKRSNNDDCYGDAQKSLGETESPRECIDQEALEQKVVKKGTHDCSRTSKHAPAEVSSKKAVPRKREVMPKQRINHRDPRFEPLSGAVDEQKTKRNYSFLDTYRDSEIMELRSAIGKTKDSQAKDQLKRTLLSTESRKKAQEIKERQQEVLRKHRKEEKVKIQQGKRPFYLKRVDQKRMALVERFKGMQGKQVVKVIERRRKKKAAKERKGMPDARRG